MTPDELRILRKQYNLTQTEFGAAIGVSRLTVFNWEKAKFAIPGDIVQRLAKANLTAPSRKAAAAKVVTPDTAPQCYRRDDKHGFTRTLAHPKWWYGAKSPFSRLCSFEDWQAIDGKSTLLELDTHNAPTPRQAFDLMVSRGILPADAARYLATMGSPLPGYVEPKRLTDDTANFPNDEWK